MNTLNELENEISRVQLKMKTLDPSSNSYGVVARNLSVLYQLRLKEINDLETRQRVKQQFETERQDKLQQTADARQDKHDEFELTQKAHREEYDMDRADRLEESAYRGRTEEENARKDRIINLIRIGVDITGVILPLIFYGGWMNRGFKFEETGTFTSATFRNLFQRFRPTK